MISLEIGLDVTNMQKVNLEINKKYYYFKIILGLIFVHLKLKSDNLQQVDYIRLLFLDRYRRDTPRLSSDSIHLVSSPLFFLAPRWPKIAPYCQVFGIYDHFEEKSSSI